MRVGIALAILIGTTAAALADSSPVLVIPGRPGVPIIINGIDASYAVVEGDWGLGKRVHVTPTVYGGRPVDPVPQVGHYYPSGGHRPGYGRLQIEPPANRRLPQPPGSAIINRVRRNPLRSRCNPRFPSTRRRLSSRRKAAKPACPRIFPGRRRIPRIESRGTIHRVNHGPNKNVP